MHEELGQLDFAPYKSFKLYLHEADSSSIRRLNLEQRTAVMHLAQRLPMKELYEVQAYRAQVLESSKNLWTMFSGLIAAATELSVRLLYCIVGILLYFVHQI